MIKPVEIKPLDKYCLWIKYSDGIEGIVDLSDYVGKGVFSAWSDYKFFKAVCIGPSGELRWGEDIDLCPDALYLKITEKQPEDIFPSLKKEYSNA
jgi:hypothetical protein